MGLILLVLLIAVPLVEIAIFIEIGDVVGLWPTLALTVATAVAGVVLMRVQGFTALAQLRARLDRGEPPVLEAIGALLLLAAGMLLLVPGFFTDVVGFLLLVPFLRRHAAEGLLAAAERRRARAGAGGGKPGRGTGPDVIDGDYRVVDEDPPRPGRISRDPESGPDGSPWRKG